jgi:argininosuccinate synthase
VDKRKYNFDVIALTIDLGSERNLPEIRQRALDVVPSMPRLSMAATSS